MVSLLRVLEVVRALLADCTGNIDAAAEKNVWVLCLLEVKSLCGMIKKLLARRVTRVPFDPTACDL